VSERVRSDLSVLLGDVLCTESPSSELLARYARDPDALSPEERRLMEFHQLNTPFVRDQIAVIRALSRTPATADAAGAGRTPARAQRPRAPRRVRRRGWIAAGATVAAGLAAALLLQGERSSPFDAEDSSRVVAAAPDPARSAVQALPADEPSAPAAMAQAPPAPTSPSGSAAGIPAAEPESEPESENSVPSPDDRPLRSPTQVAKAEPSRPAPPDVPPAEARPAKAPPQETAQEDAREEETPGELRGEIVVAQLLQIDRSGESPSIDLDIAFADGSAELTAAGRRDLRAVGDALTEPRMTGYRFRFAVHTDDRGSVDENQALSERRAAAVVDYLRSSFEIPAERIEGLGRGETEPVAEGTTDAIRAINRRVTLERIDLE
jgi:OmpA-OmpF porin, OOP family